MTRMLGRALALVTAGALIAAGAPRTVSGQDVRQQGSTELTISNVAAQLGIKVQPTATDELQIGASFTGLLDSPEKLAEFGIKGMHPGARVTVARVSPEKIRVEADEMEPVAQRGSASLKFNGRGELTKIK